MTKAEKIYLAREFRKNHTKTEQIMWEELRNRKFLNLKFKRQYLIEGYIVDFYCPELKLAIEIDGPIHLQQIKEDELRQRDIEEKGIRFIRFKNLPC
jgi:histidinol dehydrogenase